MNKKMENARMKFLDFFGYSPNFPPSIDCDLEEYADLLLKCIKDNFDYTIELYGTVVPKKMPRPRIIWD